jgi:hypothetical protein
LRIARLGGVFSRDFLVFALLFHGDLLEQFVVRRPHLVRTGSKGRQRASLVAAKHLDQLLGSTWTTAFKVAVKPSRISQAKISRISHTRLLRERYAMIEHVLRVLLTGSDKGAAPFVPHFLWLYCSVQQKIANHRSGLL